MGSEDAEERLTVINGFTIIVISLLVAGLPVRQGEALEVITTVILSLLFSAFEVKILLLLPTSLPFTFH